MINYIESKHVSFSELKRILSTSKKLNQYTNNGPVKIALEHKLESILSIKNDKRVVCVSSGTAALHAIMMLCTLKGAKSFVTPAFTFPSVVTGGLFSVDILDIDPETYTLSINDRLLDYDVVIITNLFGTSVDIEKWSRFCKENNIVLIFDNASSPLSKYKDVNICNFGDYSFGSLHHTKFLGFGEGGFAVVPTADYNEIIKISNFGFHDTKKYQPLSSNFKMSDVSASFILQHLNRYDIDRHIEIQNTMVNNVKDMTGAQVFNYKPDIVYGNMPILFNTNTNQNAFRSLNIEANKYYKPLKECKNSSAIYDRIINFPLHTSLKGSEVKHIVESIKFYLDSI